MMRRTNFAITREDEASDKNDAPIAAQSYRLELYFSDVDQDTPAFILLTSSRRH
jgi:hypothetical protein